MLILRGLGFNGKWGVFSDMSICIYMCSICCVYIRTCTHMYAHMCNALHSEVRSVVGG